MDREAVLDRLKPLASQLKARGVSSLSLFGSIARGDGRENSDIDLLFEVESARPFSLFDKSAVQSDLSNALDSRVDLVERQALHPSIVPFVEPDLVRIF